MRSILHFSPNARVGGNPRFLLATLGMMLIALGTKSEAANLRVGPTRTYLKIADAIGAANPSGGDTIIIDPGTYDELLTVDRNVTIRSTLNTTTASNPVIVDGQNSGNVVTINAGVTATLQGLIIQNGNRGVINGGTLTINDCLIQNNNGPSNFGGGLLEVGASLTVTNTTFFGNIAGEGGGVDSLVGGMSIYTNCTFVNNKASHSCGLEERSGNTTRIINCTFIKNIGGSEAIRAGAGTVETKNCLIAYNSAVNNCSASTGSTYTSLGHNFSTDGTCGGGTGDKLNVTELLAGPLLDNPGPTAGYIPPTYALHSHSPAIQAGDNSGNPTTDERGVSRSTPVDIGAFQYNGNPADLTSAPTCGYTFDVSNSHVIDVKVTYQGTDPNDGIDSLQLVSDSNDSPTLQIGSVDTGTLGFGFHSIPIENRNDALVMTNPKNSPGSGAMFQVNVEDFDGNHADCTAPLFTSIAIRQSGGSYRQTFQNLTPEQGHVHFLNGDRGIDQLEAQVNGHDYMLAGLTPDQSADLDLTPAMQEGDSNEVTLIGSGPVGSQAFALIGNGTIVRTDGTSTPEAGSTSILPGDVNGDGTVNVADAILLLKAVVGEQSLTARQRQAIGLVGSQPVTVADVVNLLRKVVGE